MLTETAFLGIVGNVPNKRAKVVRVKGERGRFISTKDALLLASQSKQLEAELIKECKEKGLPIGENYTLLDLFKTVRMALPLPLLQELLTKCLLHALANISELKPKEAADIILAFLKPQMPNALIAQIQEAPRVIDNSEEILEKIARIGREQPALAPIIAKELYDETTNPR